MQKIVIIFLIVMILIVSYFAYGIIPMDKSKILVVYPSFTQAAYQPNGFYDYYNHSCVTKCLTVHYNQSDPNQMSSSRNMYKIFKAQGYNLIDDSKLDSDPSILNNYSKVIILHNEYVTQNEFNAITSFHNVLYLYPNSLYALVKNNHDGTITLIRGHGYPSGKISNGFSWKDDTTRYEMDRKCLNLQFFKVTNGYAINCYPEYSVFYPSIWKEVDSK